MTSTFICEWDSDNIYTMIVAENTLREKADFLKEKIFSIADNEVE